MAVLKALKLNVLANRIFSAEQVPRRRRPQQQYLRRTRTITLRQKPPAQQRNAKNGKVPGTHRVYTDRLPFRVIGGAQHVHFAQAGGRKRVADADSRNPRCASEAGEQLLLKPNLRISLVPPAR